MNGTDWPARSQRPGAVHVTRQSGWKLLLVAALLLSGLSEEAWSIEETRITGPFDLNRIAAQVTEPEMEPDSGLFRQMAQAGQPARSTASEPWATRDSIAMDERVEQTPVLGSQHTSAANPAQPLRPFRDDESAESSQRTPIQRQREAGGQGAAAGDVRSSVSSWSWFWLPMLVACTLWWCIARLQGRKLIDAGMLPEEVVVSLGRRMLGHGQQIQLLRIGARILVVTQDSNGLRVLSEIIDPEEVERLVTMCLKPVRGPSGFVPMFSGNRSLQEQASHLSGSTGQPLPEQKTAVPSREITVEPFIGHQGTASGQYRIREART